MSRTPVTNRDELKEQLKTKLREIFQFENEDLDFGIYRIMNYKRKEIGNFIEKDLIEEIKEQLEIAGEEEINKVKEEFEKIKQKIKENFGESAFEDGELKEEFKNTPLGKEYYKKKKQLEEIKISEDLEKQIYNHLISFFSRYYDKGDFISKRRYGKNEKYMVPYNGEEVLFYWANKDQYYIKTTEYFRKYTFKIKGLIVNFRVVEAEEEKGNIKSAEKKFFVLNERIFDFNEDKRELNVCFEYRGLTEEEEGKYKHGQSISQDKINEEVIEILKDKLGEKFKELFEITDRETGDYKKYYIGKHLYRYTRRNTTDYFIHKDLKGFLERELDFYIKNEFLQLEDLQILEQSGYFDKLRLYLIGVRVFRNIALKIIEFLAQIENFQKKIWEKKKFIIDTHYVITLDKIKEYAGEGFLESILDEILRNEKQLEEWKELFGIEVKRKEDLILNNTLNEKEWKKLPIDTKYFDEEFKWKLLVALSKNNDLDEILDGVLIKSENWQALNLLLNKYRERIKTIYIDPPYNTGSDDFLYKDNYQHSSWLTMMDNRLRLAKELMKEEGVIFVSIDDNEIDNLNKLMKLIFGDNNFIINVVWKARDSVSNDAVISRNHNYLTIFIKSKERLFIRLHSFRLPHKSKGYLNPDNDPKGPWKPIHMEISGVRISKGLIYEIKDPYGNIYFPDEGKCWRFSKETFEKYLKEGRIIFDKNGRKKPRYKQYLYETLKTVISIWDDCKTTTFGTKELKDMFNEAVFKNPKPTPLIYKLVNLTSSKESYILDFFAGSGTTAHAVMKLNKEDSGKRKFILVEMADYFDTVIIPRIKKVAYSFNWKEGKPQDTDGIGIFFKYHTLEQYEDALENIEFEEPQKKLYEFTDYFVKYMLEWETKKSKTFLNINEMKDPFNYKLKIIENYQQKIVNVDLVETFNYLLGLNVSKYKVLEENGRRYIFIFGEKERKKIATVWRNTKDIDLEKDKEIIENQIKEFNPDEIYINGDAMVKGFKPIEPLFKSLMFERVE